MCSASVCIVYGFCCSSCAHFCPARKNRFPLDLEVITVGWLHVVHGESFGFSTQTRTQANMPKQRKCMYYVKVASPTSDGTSAATCLMDAMEKR